MHPLIPEFLFCPRMGVDVFHKDRQGKTCLDWSKVGAESRAGERGDGERGDGAPAAGNPTPSSRCFEYLTQLLRQRSARNKRSSTFEDLKSAVENDDEVEVKRLLDGGVDPSSNPSCCGVPEVHELGSTVSTFMSSTME